MTDANYCPLTEGAIWQRVTHVHCLECDVYHPADLASLGMVVESPGDLDDAHDFMDCCGNPVLEAVIESSTPVFDPAHSKTAQVNKDAHIVRYDRFRYVVGDDLMDALGVL